MRASVTRRNGSALIGAAGWGPALNKLNGNWVAPRRPAQGELRKRAGGLASRGRRVPVAGTAGWAPRQVGGPADAGKRGPWGEEILNPGQVTQPKSLSIYIYNRGLL